jgi:hypothetical protein
VDLTPLGPAFGVTGVVVGAVLVFVAQWLSRRQNSALAIAEQRAALRVDRHKAINDFIEVVQRIRVLESRFPIIGAIENPRGISDDTQTLLAEMWFRRGCLEVVCRPAVYEAALDYANLVQVGVLGTVIEGLMLEGELKFDFESRVVMGPDGKPELKIISELDPKKRAFMAAERKFFRAARLELYEAEISD